MNCGTRSCENLRWNLSLFLFFFFNFVFSIQQQCVESIMQMQWIFPLCLHLEAEEFFCSYKVGNVRKKSGLLEKVVFCQFWKENMSRAWFLNLFGFILKLFFLKKKKSVISFDLLASEKRSESVPSAKGSVLAWLVLASVPYSCWRWTVAPEPILPCQSWPFFMTCQHVTGVDWKLLKRGRVAWLSFSM